MKFFKNYTRLKVKEHSIFETANQVIESINFIFSVKQNSTNYCSNTLKINYKVTTLFRGTFELANRKIILVIFRWF